MKHDEINEFTAARRPCDTAQPGSTRPATLTALASITLIFAALAGCGGGGGSAGTTFPASAAAPAAAPSAAPAAAPVAEEAAPATPVATTAPVVPVVPVAPADPAPAPVDTIVSSASVEQLCTAPRTGTDPDTGRPYTDSIGSVEDGKKWVRAWIDETYLWFDEVPVLRSALYPTPQAYFEVLKTPAVTASGKPKDQFHFMVETPAWLALSQSGVEAGYGFELAILRPQIPRDIRVAYTDPGSPAALAGIERGARVLAVDGLDAVNGVGAATLNAGLFPKAVGEVHSIKLVALDGTERTVSLTAANVTKVPVQNVKVLDTPTGKVGYLQFNDHIQTSEAQLIAAIRQLQAAGVQDLVLDIRYNGGGLLAIASQLAYMVATPAATAGTTFERLVFNSKNPFNVTEAQTNTPFYSTSLGFSTPRGEPLPQLGLSKVTVLTGRGTCSASESIINGLRGVDVQVNIIGETTCGKPYGFLPQDNCGTTYFAIQFKGANNKGAGDYSDGIAPTCSVPDDFSKPLGNAAEGRLAAALGYRASGICPLVAASALEKSSLAPGTGQALLSGRSPARSERLVLPIRN